MQKIFLTSSVHRVAGHIAQRLGPDVGCRLLFVTTASEAESGDMSWRDTDRSALVAAGFEVSDYTFTNKTKDQIAADLDQTDILFIEGGNTYYLLQKIQESECADVIRDFVKDGKPYIGCSAGSCVAGPDIYPLRHTDPLKDIRQLESYEGLGLVDFIVLPHWGGEDFKELYLNKRIRFNYNEDHKLFFLTDNQYVYVENEWLQFIDVRLNS